MDEHNEIVERVRNFLQARCKLTLESCYFVAKDLQEQLWEEIRDEGSEQDEEFSDFEAQPEADELDEDLDETIPDELPDLPSEPKPASKKAKPRKPLIKRPQVGIE